MHTAESNRPTVELTSPTDESNWSNDEYDRPTVESNRSNDEYDRPTVESNWSLDETNRIMRIERSMNYTTTVSNKGEKLMVNSSVGILRENLTRKDRLEIKKKKEILQE